MREWPVLGQAPMRVWGLVLLCGVVWAVLDEEELSALLGLSETTKGEDWETPWPLEDTERACSWFGVTCETIAGREHVTRLILSRNGLEGALSNDLALPYLAELDLSGNRITGTVPEWPLLANLRIL